MNNEDSDWTEEFLSAVEELRGDDDSVRTTKHTSSVNDEGWASVDNNAS